MNQHARRLLLPFLTALLSLLLFLLPSAHAESLAEGAIGTDAAYEITDDGVLAITGMGTLPDVTPETRIFGDYASTVDTLIIDAGITEIGSNFFLGLNITYVTIPDTVTDIGDYAVGYLYRNYRYEKMPYFVVCGATGSAAESYATANGFLFVASDSENPHGTCGNGIFWSLDKDGVLTVTGNGAVGEASNDHPHSFATYATEHAGYIIRSLVVSEGITEIGNGAFADLNALTSVSLPSTLKTIGNSAFANCMSLPSIEIPGNVDSIGTAAFSSCLALTDLTLKEGITEIGPRAFELVSIKTLRLPSTLVTLGENAFFACESLKTADIRVLSEIPVKAFAFCEQLTSVTFHSSLLSIGRSAFEGCTSLASLSFPSTLVNIGDRAFLSCTSLTSVQLPNSVTSLGTYLFRDCTALQDIVFGDNALVVPEGAFYGCTALSNVKIGASIETIGECAFADCTALKSLLVPSRVKTIGSYALGYIEDGESYRINPAFTLEIRGYLPSVAQIYAAANQLTFTSLGYTHSDGGYLTPTANWSIETAKGVLKINGSGRVPDYPSFESTPWAIYREQIRSVVIDNGIENVGSSSFEGCTNLVNLAAPSSVTFIGSYAFADTAIVTLTLPVGLREIDTGAFEGCKSLHNINLPSSLETIGQYAFRGPNTAPSIFVPSSVTYIGTYAIGFNSDDTPNTEFTVKGSRGSVAEHYAEESGLGFVENGYINIEDKNATGSYISIPGNGPTGYTFHYTVDGFTMEPSILLPNGTTVFVCTLKLTEEEYTRSPEGISSMFLTLPEEILRRGNEVIKNLRVYAMSEDGLFTEVTLLETPSSENLLSFTHTSLGTFVVTDADLTKLVTLTVKYQDKNGNALSDNLVVRAVIGTSYRFEAPDMNDLVVDNAHYEGKASADLTFTFTYSPKTLQTDPVITQPVTSESPTEGAGTRVILIILLIVLVVALIAAVFLLVYLNKKKKKEALETQKTMSAAKKQKGADKFAQTIIVPEFKTQELDIQSLFADEPEEDTEAEENLKKIKSSSPKKRDNPPKNR